MRSPRTPAAATSPSRLAEIERACSAATLPTGADARRRLRNRLSHAAPAAERSPDSTRARPCSRSRTAGTGRRSSARQRARAPLRATAVRPRLHEPLLRPPRERRASALPRRGAPRRAASSSSSACRTRPDRDARSDWRAAHARRRLARGRCSSASSDEQLAEELGGGEILLEGRWFVVGSLPSGATARSPRSSATPRSAARAPRPATRSSRCRSRSAVAGQRAYLYGQAPGVVEGEQAAAVARPGRADAPPLARARRGRRSTRRSTARRSRAAIRAGRRRGAATGRRRRASRSSARSGASGSCALLRPALDRHRRRARDRGGCSACRSSRSASARGSSSTARRSIPLPHPSGASSWLNEPANRGDSTRALELVAG